MVATILLSFLGAFYVFAGVVAVRVGLTSRVVDRAIEAITLGKTSKAEVGRSRINLTIAMLTLLGGLLLMARLELAGLAFLACAALQAAYFLLIAPRWLDPADPTSPAGRRQSLNAFVIYLAATALVAWAWSTGRLVALEDTECWRLGMVAGAAVVFAAWVYRSRRPSADR